MWAVCATQCGWSIYLLFKEIIHRDSQCLGIPLEKPLTAVCPEHCCNCDESTWNMRKCLFQRGLTTNVADTSSSDAQSHLRPLKYPLESQGVQEACTHHALAAWCSPVISIPSSLAQESFVFCWYGRNCNQQTGQFLYRLKFSNRKSIFQESPTILRLVFYTEIKSFSDTADFFIDSSYEITMKYVQTYVHTHKIWRYDIDYRCAFKMETWLETNLSSARSSINQWCLLKDIPSRSPNFRW